MQMKMLHRRLFGVTVSECFLSDFLRTEDVEWSLRRLPNVPRNSHGVTFSKKRTSSHDSHVKACPVRCFIVRWLNRGCLLLMGVKPFGYTELTRELYHVARSQPPNLFFPAYFVVSGDSAVVNLVNVTNPRSESD